MSKASVTLPESSSAGKAGFYQQGTLSYSQRQLYVLFFWLMWNDFTVMLLEQPPALGVLLSYANGATNTQLALFNTFGGIVGIWINPFFSTWSDRTRTPWGRRRPFLFWSTPPLALSVAAMPYMPTLYYHLAHFHPAFAHFFQHFPINGAVLLLFAETFALGVFNGVVLAIFSYLYWDVVPENVLGRWTAVTKVITALCGLVWNFFLLGLAQHHMKSVCLGIAIFCLTVYLVSLWKVKEGEYPPPDEHKKGGILAPLRSYFVECFSDTYYLWIFFGFCLQAQSRLGDNLKQRFIMVDLHLPWDIIGKINTIPSVLIIALGFYFGSMVDRLHPVRLMPPTYFAWALTCLGSYFFINGAWSYLFWSTLTQLAIFANNITYGALLVEIFPREKLGQFASANQLFNQAVGLLIGIPAGIFFDYIHSDRFSYFAAALFLFACSAVWVKILRDFNRRKGQVPVPHAG
jgi:maltose/moltooligosaccharide transporter